MVPLREGAQDGVIACQSDRSRCLPTSSGHYRHVIESGSCGFTRHQLGAPESMLGLLGSQKPPSAAAGSTGAQVYTCMTSQLAFDCSLPAFFSCVIKNNAITAEHTHTHTHSQRRFPSCFSSFLSVLALGPTVILRVYSCLDLGPETGRLQHV